MTDKIQTVGVLTFIAAIYIILISPPSVIANDIVQQCYRLTNFSEGETIEILFDLQYTDSFSNELNTLMAGWRAQNLTEAEISMHIRTLDEQNQDVTTTFMNTSIMVVEYNRTKLLVLPKNLAELECPTGLNPKDVL